MLQLSALLRTARGAIERARDFADADQPDKAYVEYLRAFEVTVNTIPHHADYSVMAKRWPGLYKEFADLMMVCIALITPPPSLFLSFS